MRPPHKIIGARASALAHDGTELVNWSAPPLNDQNMPPLY
jgi:hypothetical protein